MSDTGSLSLHFEGEIVTDHLVSARTLGKTLVHTQNAIDRAYLDLKYGNLWKYARMKGEDYPRADFFVLYPEEGGFIQELASSAGKEISFVSRIHGPVQAQATSQAHDIKPFPVFLET